MKFSLLVESGILGFGRLLEPGIRHEESAIPLTIRIRNPSPTEIDWNPEPGIWNQQRGIQNPRSIFDCLTRGTLALSPVGVLEFNNLKQSHKGREARRNSVPIQAHSELRGGDLLAPQNYSSPNSVSSPGF